MRDTGNENLWYVVQGQSSTHSVLVNTDILEVADGLSDYIAIIPFETYFLDGKIRPAGPPTMHGE
jgi:hypothetical protein